MSAFLNENNIKYSKDNLLGAGGFGKVYLGDYFGTPVAIKIMKKKTLTKDGIEEMMRENKIHESLKHPQIVEFFGCVKFKNGNYGTVLSYCEGGTLSELVYNNKVKTEKDMFSISLQLARAMTFLHNRHPPVIHFDLKPENILIDRRTPPYTLKISDFGLSGILRTMHTEATVRGYTPPYAAPETALGHRRATSAADMFAVGSILYFIATKKNAFVGRDREELMGRIAHGLLPPIPPGTPGWLHEAIGGCWAHSTAARWSALQLAEHLMEADKILFARKPVMLTRSVALPSELPHTARTSTELLDYSAFPNANRLWFADVALRKPMAEAHGLLFSEPLYLPEIPGGQRTGLITTVSERGILCFGDTHTRSVVLFDLFSRRTATVFIPRARVRFLFGFVFGGDLYVAWDRSNVLFSCDVNDVFAGKPLADFSTCALERCIANVPMLDNAFEGCVVFADAQDFTRAQFVNLAEGRQTALEARARINSFGSLHGLEVPNVLFVGTSADTGHVCGFSEANEYERLLAAPCLCPNVLLSNTNMRSLWHAAVWSPPNNLNYKGSTFRLEAQVCPSGYIPFVRLFGELFICYDGNMQSWCAVKISVP